MKMELRERYLELLKNSLLDLHRSPGSEYHPATTGKKINYFVRPLMKLFKKMDGHDFAICERVDFNRDARLNGKDWPVYAETMIGYKRLSNVQYCVTEVIRNNIPGDLIETGVWRGGAVIFMRAILEAYDVKDRIVWVADSFEGLPRPNAEKYVADRDDELYKYDILRVSMEEVQNNFRKYNLLDGQVKFLKGWFRDTLPSAPINKLAVLRLDGDMYESTTDALKNLYPKLSPGGFVIVDDYQVIEACRLAVQDYRAAHKIGDEIISIDDDGVYWKKTNKN
jgi:O-methyltransferase